MRAKKDISYFINNHGALGHTIADKCFAYPPSPALKTTESAYQHRAFIMSVLSFIRHFSIFTLIEWGHISRLMPSSRHLTPLAC
jgi:hypothetical protein